MSVNCVYCGHVNPDGSTVCLSCGRTLPPPPAAADSFGQQSWGQPPQPPPGGPSSYPPADPYGGSYPPAQAPGSWQQPESYGQPPQQGYGNMTPPGPSYGQQPAPWQAPAGGFGGFAALPPDVVTAQKQAKAAMICAIVGVFCCQVVFGPIGIVLGIMSKSALSKRNVQEGQGFALTGIILGSVDIVIFVLYLIISLAINR